MNIKRVITNALILAALGGAVWFLVLPNWSAVAIFRKEIATKKEVIELEKQAIEKLNSAISVLEEQKQGVEKMEEALPVSELKPELIAIMAKLASQNGLSLSKLDIQSAEEKASRTPKGSAGAASGESLPVATSVKSIRISLDTTGSYASFKNWLQAVEKNLRIFDVSKISFSVREKKLSTGEMIAAADPAIDFSVVMNTYFIKK